MTVRRLETVHRLRYFRFCNVLHIWTIRAIPTYRVGITYWVCASLGDGVGGGGPGILGLLTLCACAAGLQ